MVRIVRRSIPTAAFARTFSAESKVIITTLRFVRSPASRFQSRSPGDEVTLWMMIRLRALALFELAGKVHSKGRHGGNG